MKSLNQCLIRTPGLAVQLVSMLQWELAKLSHDLATLRCLRVEHHLMMSADEAPRNRFESDHGSERVKVTRYFGTVRGCPPLQLDQDLLSLMTRAHLSATRWTPSISHPGCEAHLMVNIIRKSRHGKSVKC